MLEQLGFVYMIDPIADPNTRTFTITLLLSNRIVRGELPDEEGFLEVFVADDRKHAEATAAEDRRERTAARSDELAFAESGISLRWDEDLKRLRASRLDAIDRALEDMAGRNYGVCVRCQGLITTERLRETPDTCVCTECAGRSAPVG